VTCAGQELWQYQPPEHLPDLFDDLTAEEEKESEDDYLPLYFDTDKDLATPRPDTSGISAEDLD
jgi:hypothetical protein